MGFLESKVFQDTLATVVIGYFGLMFYSLFRKQTVKETFEQIKEWWENMEGDEE